MEIPHILNGMRETPFIITTCRYVCIQSITHGDQKMIVKPFDSSSLSLLFSANQSMASSNLKTIFRCDDVCNNKQ